MTHLAIAFLLFSLSLFGQSTDAAISGIVTDAQGAVVPGVRVTATNTDTGVKNAVRTNEAGFYSIRPLPIGKYNLTAEVAGFRRHTEQGIVLAIGQSLELNFKLEIGTVTETITVSASSSLLETRSADASQVIESKSIEDLPLGDRRSMNLIEITGAAVWGGYDTGSKPNFSLAGGRMQSQQFYIDGASAQNMRIGVGQMDLDPPVETLLEVKVMENNFSAELGGSAGGAIIATTKSGTNRYRGSLSEFFRNQVMDAPNFFSPVFGGEKQKPALRYNVFGASMGGPVKRDKIFFFASYEGSRRRDGSVRTLTVPSLLEIGGDFSKTVNAKGQVYAIYDPWNTTAGTAQTRTPFPGNRIPANRFDPVGRTLAQLYPVPNRTADDLSGANNFRNNDVNAYTRDNGIIKIDYNLSNRNKLTGRYIYNQDLNAQRSIYPVPATDTINDQDAHQQYWYGTWTRIVSPTIVNEARFSYGRRYYRTHNKGCGQDWPTKLGLKGVPDNCFPYVTAAGYDNLGGSTQDRQQFPIQQYHVLDNVTIVHGRHTVKFGAEMRPSKNHEIDYTTISGQLAFTRGLSGLPGNAQTGNALASMLLGIVGTFNQQGSPVLERKMRYLGGFVQEDWAVHPGLTLNFGLRWEADTPFNALENRFNSFDSNQINPVSGTPGVIKFGGVAGWTTQPYHPDWNNFGPRFGFAWKPLGLTRTVLRGGFGIFYAHPFDGAVANNVSLGFSESASLVLADNSNTIPYTMGGGLPLPQLTAPVLDDTYGAVKVGQTANTTPTYLDPGRRTGYSEQFNLRIQQELRNSILVEAGYVGNLSRKLPGANIAINQIRPELLQPTSQQKNRPFPQFSGVTIVSPSFGISSYHAGMAKIEKRFSHGMNMLATYTWSKFCDNSGSGPGSVLGGLGAAYSDYYNRRADWGPSSNDIRQRVTVSSVYQIPLGKGRAYLTENPMRHVLGNWQVGVVMVNQTGAPLTVQTTTNTTYAYSSGAQRADVLRDPNLPGDQRSILQWFDTNAFVQPGVNKFGNQGVGLVRAPGIFNLNASIIRVFRVAEGKNLQFRGEFFNLPNHTNFNVPGHTMDASGFGIVNAARPARQVQLGLRLTY